jgi:hypothetical protein
MWKGQMKISKNPDVMYRQIFKILSQYVWTISGMGEKNSNFAPMAHQAPQKIQIFTRIFFFSILFILFLVKIILSGQLSSHVEQVVSRQIQTINKYKRSEILSMLIQTT